MTKTLLVAFAAAAFTLAGCADDTADTNVNVETAPMVNDPMLADTTVILMDDSMAPGTAVDPMAPGTTADPMAPGTMADPMAPGTTADPMAPGTTPDATVPR